MRDATFSPVVLEPVGVWSFLQKKLTISPEGIFVGRRLARWEDVGFYRCTWDLAAMGQLEVATDEMLITVNESYHGWRRGADLVLEQLHQRLPETAPADYRPFDLEDECLRHPTAGELPLRELAEITLTFISDPVFTVTRRMAGRWVECNLAEINNPFLFLEALALKEARFVIEGPARWPEAVSHLDLLGKRGALPAAVTLKRRR
jgi:hypothetical protein